MKYVLIALTLSTLSYSFSKPVIAARGSEACVTYCTDSATARYTENTPAWSAFFNGCMRTCTLN